RKWWGKIANAKIPQPSAFTAAMQSSIAPIRARSPLLDDRHADRMRATVSVMFILHRVWRTKEPLRLRRTNRPSSEDWIRDVEVGDRAHPRGASPLRDSAGISPDFAALDITPASSPEGGRPGARPILPHGV